MHLCDCLNENSRLRARRRFRAKLQLKLPFPTVPYLMDKRRGPSLTILLRQPNRFPPGAHRRDLSEGPGWRVEYERQWSEQRKAAGLPHVVVHPWPSPRTREAIGFGDIDLTSYGFTREWATQFLDNSATHDRLTA